MTTQVPLAEAVAVARPVVESIVWCTVSTVTPDGTAPRSRLMHPVWFWEEGEPYALVSARRTPLKVAHLDAHPAVACSYWDPSHATCVIDAAAAWLDEGELADTWDRIRAVPEPVGFDPAIIWPEGPDAEGVAFLRFDAHRIVATSPGAPSVRWSSAAQAQYITDLVADVGEPSPDETDRAEAVARRIADRSSVHHED